MIMIDKLLKLSALEVDEDEYRVLSTQINEIIEFLKEDIEKIEEPKEVSVDYSKLREDKGAKTTFKNNEKKQYVVPKIM